MHLDACYQSKGNRGLVEFRKHALNYIKGIRDASKFKNELVNLTNYTEIREWVERFFNC